MVGFILLLSIGNGTALGFSKIHPDVTIIRKIKR